MAALRGQLRALSNDRDLRRFVVQATPTGVHLGTGSYGSVEEVWPRETSSSGGVGHGHVQALRNLI